MEDLSATIGELLSGHRARGGLTQAGLAARAGVSVRALQDIEHDRDRCPSAQTLAALSRALGLSPSDGQALLLARDATTSREGDLLRIGVLGPLSVSWGELPVEVGPFKQRLLLGLLAVHGGLPVTADEIVEVLWPDRPPPSYQNLIHTYVARLRRCLGPGRDRGAGRAIRGAGGSYRLELPADQLDLVRFEELIAGAWSERQRDAGLALDLFERALRCWRGQVLADVGTRLAQHPAVVAPARRRLGAALAFADVAIGLGRFELAAELLPDIAEAEPLHEGLHARLMLALAGAGQQAAALRQFAAARTRLAEELGVVPGHELTDAYLRVLRQDLPTTDREPAAGQDQQGNGRPPPSRQAVAGGAARDGAPAAIREDAPAVVPAQLPADVPDFIGRAAELDRLEELSGSAGGTLIISAVTGAPGVGKTALAVHWAHRAAGRYPDGQLYVDLRGYSTDPPLRPIEALRRMLTVCGVAGEHIPADADEAAGVLRSLLAGRRMLVVLDNAATAEQVRPLLPGGPGCLVLVTSRDRLDGLVAMQGARRVGVDVLAQDEAITLLARIIGQERVREEPGAATELAELCGHLPLAMRIAAAQLAAGQDPIAQYVAELRAGHRVARLAVGGDERHAGVEAAFDRSYTALSILERRVFRLAALAPGADFTVEAAAALAGIPADRAAAALSGLTRAHLVQRRAHGRYQFHDLLRLYAQAQARAEDEEVEREAGLLRLITEHAAAATEASRVLYPQKLQMHPDQVSPSQARFADNAAALAWFEAERVNLVAAVCEAADRLWPAVGQLAHAMRGYMESAHHLDDWTTVATRGLAVMSAVGDARGEAASLISLAIVRGCRAEFDESRDGFAAALAGARRHGWPDIEAVALNNLGIVYEKTGRLDQAAECYGGALVLYRRIGWHVGLGMCHANLGYVYYLRGMLERAEANQAEALRLADRDGAVGVGALALEHLGVVFRARGLLAPALDCLTRALDRHRDVGNRYGESSALNHLGAAYRDAGDHVRGRDVAEAALSLARDIGHGDVQVEALITLGGACLCLGDPAGAAVHQRRALELAGGLGLRFAEVQALIGLATAQRALGQPVPALVSGRRALARARQRGYRLLEGQAGAELAAIHLGCGQAGSAARRAALARPLLAGSGAEEDAARLDTLLSVAH